MMLKNVITGLVLFATVGISPLVAQGGNVVATGTFHGLAHKTSGRATVYHTTNGNVLRLTHFKTSNGPNTHVLLIAASDAKDDENIFGEKVDHLDLGPLKGTQGDQNYTLPANVDLSKYKTVAIFCERFTVTFGAAPLEK